MPSAANTAFSGSTRQRLSALHRLDGRPSISTAVSQRAPSHTLNATECNVEGTESQTVGHRGMYRVLHRERQLRRHVLSNPQSAHSLSFTPSPLQSGRPLALSLSNSSLNRFNLMLRIPPTTSLPIQCRGAMRSEMSSPRSPLQTHPNSEAQSS